MSPEPAADIVLALFRELVEGSSDPKARTYVLNQGDRGLLASLDKLSAAAASATHGGGSIAAHVDHLRYGFTLQAVRRRRSGVWTQRGSAAVCALKVHSSSGGGVRSLPEGRQR